MSCPSGERGKGPSRFFQCTVHSEASGLGAQEWRAEQKQSKRQQAGSLGSELKARAGLECEQEDDQMDKAALEGGLETVDGQNGRTHLVVGLEVGHVLGTPLEGGRAGGTSVGGQQPGWTLGQETSSWRSELDAGNRESVSPVEPVKLEANETPLE